MGAVRRVAKGLALGASLLLGAAGVGVVFLLTPPGNELIRRQIEARGTEALAEGRLVVGELSWNGVSRLELREVALLDGDGREVIGLDALELRYGLGGLLRRTVRLGAVALDTPRVDLRVGEDGRLDVTRILGLEPGPDAPPSAWGGLPLRVELGALTLRDGRVGYQDGATRVAIDGLTVDLGGWVEGRRARIEGLRLAAALGAPVEGDVEVGGALGYEHGDLALDALRVAFAQTALTLDGRVAAVETAPEIAASVALDRLAAADLEALAGAPVLVDDLRGAIEVQGPPGDLRLRGQLGAMAGTLDLDGAVDLSADPLIWRMDLQTDGLDLHRLVAAVTEPTHLDGRYSVRGQGTSWPDALDVELEVAAADQVFWGEAVQGLTLMASLSRGVIEVQSLQGRHALGRLDVKGTVDVPGERVRAVARADVPDLGALSRFGVEGMQGAAHLDARVAVGWGAAHTQVEVDGAVRGSGVGVAGVRAEELSGPVQVRLAGDDLSVSGDFAFTALALPGVSVAEGTLNAVFSTGPAVGSSAQASLAARGVDAGRVGEWPLQVEELSGTATFEQGPDGPRRAVAQLQTTGVRLPPGRVASGPVAVTLEGDRVSASASLDAADGPVLGLDASGDLAAGTWSADRLEVAPTAEIVWRAAEPVRLRLADGGARDLSLALTSDAGAVAVRGEAVLDAPELAFEIANLDMRYVLELGNRVRGLDEPAQLAGRLDLTGRLGVTGDFPEVEADLHMRELAIPGGPSGLDLTLSLDETGRVARLEGELGRKGERWLRLGGEVPLALGRRLDADPAEPEQIGLDCAGTVSLRALVGPFDRAEIEAALPDEPPPVHAASADLRVFGPACDPDIEVVGAALAQLGDDGERVRLDLDARRDGQDLVVTALVEEDLERRLRLEGGGLTGLSDVMGWALRGAPKPALAAPDTWLRDGELSMQTMSVPMAAVSRLIGLGDIADGELGGGLSLAGSAHTLQASGALVLQGGRLGAVDLDAGQLILVPAEGGYQLMLNLDFAEAGGLGVSGFVPLALNLEEAGSVDALLGREGLALRVEGDGLPMGALVGVVPGLVAAEGLMKISGEVGGTLLKPTPVLRVQSQGAALTYAGTEVTYTVNDLDLALTRDLLRIATLSMGTRPRYGAGLRRGSLKGTGEIALTDFAPGEVDLTLAMDEFWASATSSYVIALNGDLDVGGRWPELRLAGPVALAEGRITLGRDFFLDVASLDLAPELEIQRSKGAQVAAAARAPEIYEGFELDLDVDLLRNLRLVVEMPTTSGYGQQFAELTTVTLDAEFDGLVDLTGEVGAPALKGRVETVRGTANLMGVTFELEPESSLSWVGDDIANPLLDMKATVATGSYGDVNVGISGDVDHIALDFSSEEYPDPADVMSLLLFGKPTSEMSDSEGQAGAAILGAALSSVTGQVERLVGLDTLDQFEIDPSAGAVRVGKALSDTLFLSLQLSPSAEDNENRTQATVEWLIQRRLYAEFVTGDRGQSSADLYWRWRF